MGGTGLEPVTPSLSTRSSGSRRFAEDRSGRMVERNPPDDQTAERTRANAERCHCCHGGGGVTDRTVSGASRDHGRDVLSRDGEWGEKATALSSATALPDGVAKTAHHPGARARTWRSYGEGCRHAYRDPGRAAVSATFHQLVASGITRTAPYVPAPKCHERDRRMRCRGPMDRQRAGWTFRARSM
jgi:hypothetical protein